MRPEESPAGRGRSVGRVACPASTHGDRTCPSRDPSDSTRRSPLGDRPCGRGRERTFGCRLLGFPRLARRRRGLAGHVRRSRRTRSALCRHHSCQRNHPSARPIGRARGRARWSTPVCTSSRPGRAVRDLITAAGGVSPDGDLDRLNLAAPLADGVRLYVPRRGRGRATNRGRTRSTDPTGCDGPRG